MADTTPQSFENHTRIVPPFHVVTLGIFVINLVWTLYRLVTYPAADTVISLLLAVAFLLLAFYARIFSLTVQDRVIRQEMRLRMKELLPQDLQARINEFTPRQLVALRFASDAELPGLCRTVLTDKVSDGKAIKKMIKQWNADHLRA
jgi:hypothetical protein